MSQVTKPVIAPVQLENIPQALKSIDRWFLWRHVMKDDGTYGKMPTRAEKFIRNGQSTNKDGGTFVSFDEAVKWYEYHNSRGDNVGLSTAMGIKGEPGNILGLDFDGCLNSKQELAPWADKIIREIEGIAYIEVSPSGTGLKAMVNGGKPDDCRKSVIKYGEGKQQIEAYDNNRFWTVTGDIWGDDNYGQRDQVKVRRALDVAGYFKDDQPKLNLRPVYTEVDSDDYRLNQYLSSCGTATEGGRNNSLFSIAGHIKVNFNLSDSDVLRHMIAFNARNISPPLSDHEVRMSVDSACGSAFQNLESTSEDRGPAPEKVDMSNCDIDFDKLIKNSNRSQKMRLTDDDLRVGGLIDEIMDNYREVAKDWLPELAFACALNTVATAMAGRVEIKDNGAVPCTFSVGLAPSGSGKDFGRKLTEEILFEAGMDDRVGPEGVSSAEGFIKILENQPNVIFQLDEAGELFGDMGDTKSHMKRFGKALKEAFSKAGSKFWKPNARADAANNVVIKHPNAIVYCTTTPDRFWSSFSDESVQDGLMGRLLIFENTKYDKRLGRRYRKPAPTESIIARVRAWSGEGNLPDSVSDIKRMEWELTDDAHAVFVETDNQIRLKNQAGGIADALWARLPDKAHILALIIAGSRQGPQVHGRIEREDMEKSLRIIKRMTRRAIERCTEEVSVNQVDSKRKRLHKAIIKKGKVAKGKISLISQWTNRAERDSLLAELVESGKVRLIEDTASGKQFYQAV